VTSIPADTCLDQPARHTTTARLPAVGTALVAASLPLIGLLHVLPPSDRIDPMTRTISEYALGSNGWLFDVAVLALAIGSTAVTVALVRARVLAATAPATWLLGLWSAGLTTVVIFEKHNWAVGPSSGGQIHRMASLVAFLALPVGALLASRSGRLSPAWERQAAWTRWSALGAVAALLPLFYAVAVNMLTGRAWWRVFPLGAVERLLGLSEVLVVLVLGVWAVRARAADPDAPSVS
jgi:hypothetical protein